MLPSGRPLAQYALGYLESYSGAVDVSVGRKLYRCADCPPSPPSASIRLKADVHHELCDFGKGEFPMFI